MRNEFRPEVNGDAAKTAAQPIPAPPPRFHIQTCILRPSATDAVAESVRLHQITGKCP